MDIRSQAATEMAEQLEQQNTAWQHIRFFIDNLDPRTRLTVDETVLADIEAVCSEVFAPAGGVPPLGLRG